MWDRILQFLPLGCRHRHMSLPFSHHSSARRNPDAPWEKISSESSHPYVVCLDCGKQFEYDWANMRVVK
jgi:hypothetical protein